MVVEGHRSFWGGFYVPCDRNPHAVNAAMIDEDEVVAPALVPDRPSPATVSRRSVRRAVSARQVTEASFGTRLQRNAPRAVTASVLEQHHTDVVTASRKSEPRRRVHAPVQEPHHKDAVTASVTTASRLPVTAPVQEPRYKDAVTASVTTDALSTTVIREATYAAQWQAKTFYCFHTADDYDPEFDDVDDSDSDDGTGYGNRSQVYRVSAKDREDDLELKQVKDWVTAFAKMAAGAEWPSSQKGRFGYCPCSHQKAAWRKSHNLYSCDENRNALEGRPDKYRNCSGDRAPRAPWFKLEAFIAHCKDFALKRHCPLHFAMYSFVRKLYELKWPKDMKKNSAVKYITNAEVCQL